MKKILLNLVFLSMCLPGMAQSRSSDFSVSLENRPLRILIEEIQAKTDYKIFYNPGDIEGIYVFVEAVNRDPVNVLMETISPRDLMVTVSGNYIFIAKGQKFITELPRGYFDPAARIADGTGGMLAAFADEEEGRAVSENKVYRIGRPTSSSAERVTVSGNVTDFKTGDPLSGISVYVNEPSVLVRTDKKGDYKILLPPGRHTLNLEGEGIGTTRRQIMLYADGRLDIELAGQVHEMEEIVVSVERLENVRGTILGVERLKMTEIKNIPTAFGEADIIKIIMSLPGVKAASEASSGFNVRGGATDQNLILFNNGTIYNPTHLFGFFSAFNPDIVQDMELYKSSVPAKYGGRISSVLDINTREGNMEKLKGAASIGLLTSRLSLEGPIAKGKTSFLLGGRTTYSDWILRQLPEKSGYRDGNAAFYDMNGVLTHRFSERDRLELSGYFSHDKFKFDQDERYKYRNANTSLKWTHTFNMTHLMAVAAGYDHYDHNTYFNDNPAEAYKYSFGIDQYFGRADFIWQAADSHTVEYGASAIVYDLNPGRYLPDGAESLVEVDRLQREKGLETGFYFGDKWDISNALSLNVGVRYSIYNTLGPKTYLEYDKEYLPSPGAVRDTIRAGSGFINTYHGPEFRVSLRYEFTNGFSMKAGFNTMRQNIHKLSNTTVMSPTDTWKLSDVNIKPQTGMQAAFGLYKNLANHTVELSLEGYYKTMKNYLDYKGGAQLIMNHNIETDVLPTKGRAYGVEFMIKKSAGNLTGWMSYTYSKTELRQNDSRITNPVNGGEWYPADYDKPHEFKFVGNYKVTQRFSFSLNCDYSTGRPITVPVSKYLYGSDQYVYYSDRNGYRVKDFFRMDASFNIEPRHRQTQRTHSSFTIGVYNLTGRKNVYSVYYKLEEGVLRGYQLSIFGVPIPYAAYNIKF